MVKVESNTINPLPVTPAAPSHFYKSDTEEHTKKNLQQIAFSKRMNNIMGNDMRKEFTPVHFFSHGSKFFQVFFEQMISGNT